MELITKGWHELLLVRHWWQGVINLEAKDEALSPTTLTSQMPPFSLMRKDADGASWYMCSLILTVDYFSFILLLFQGMI